MTVETLEEARKGATIDKIKSEYEKNEDQNYHSENIALLAKHFGTEEEHANTKKIIRSRNKEGSLPDRHRPYQNMIHGKYIHHLYPTQMAEGVALDEKTKGQNKTLKRRALRHREKGSELNNDKMMGDVVRRGYGSSKASGKLGRNHIKETNMTDNETPSNAAQIIDFAIMENPSAIAEVFQGAIGAHVKDNLLLKRVEVAGKIFGEAIKVSWSEPEPTKAAKNVVAATKNTPAADKKVKYGCRACHGTGKVHTSGVDIESCKSCKGTGMNKSQWRNDFNQRQARYNASPESEAYWSS